MMYKHFSIEIKIDLEDNIFWDGKLITPKMIEDLIHGTLRREFGHDNVEIEVRTVFTNRDQSPSKKVTVHTVDMEKDDNNDN